MILNIILIDWAIFLYINIYVLDTKQSSFFFKWMRFAELSNKKSRVKNA